VVSFISHPEASSSWSLLFEPSLFFIIIISTSVLTGPPCRCCQVLERQKLQKHPFLVSKIIQLYDSKLTRHCNMLVGRTMAGKSVAWNTLAQAKTDMGKEDKVRRR
jgi:hypothetical protein